LDKKNMSQDGADAVYKEYGWYKGKRVLWTLPKNGGHYPSHEVYNGVMQYRKDRRAHVHEIGNEVVGVYLLHKEGLISKNVRQHLLQFIHRPLHHQNTKLDADDSYGRAFVIFASIVIVLVILIILCMEPVSVTAYPTDDVVFAGSGGLPGPPGPPGMCRK